ncbi:related to Pheromone receptor a2 [Ustilago sp. UG-2017b]|nr:related to Pheromone receptor a2 [Ustilago sp. UG-2017b]
MFSTAENAIYGVLCLITACLSISSLPVHVRAGNTGVILMMSWCFVGLFNKGVNALAFNHSLNISWNFGCDAHSTHIDSTWLKISVAVRQSTIPYLPCSSTTSGDFSSAFCALSTPFSAALSSQHSGLSQKKYFRLFALALCEATLIAVAQLYLLFAALRITGLLPYPSWEYVHSGFATINLVPMDRSGASSSTLTSLEVFRWFTLSPGIVLFVFFGLTEDAKSAYIGLWQAIKRLRFKVRKECGLTEGPTGFQDISLDLDDLREQSCKVSVVVHKDVTVL